MASNIVEVSDAIKRYISATGKGRRPALPEVQEITNQFLLEFSNLQNSYTYANLFSVASHFECFQSAGVTFSQFKTMCESVKREAFKREDQELAHYLGQKVDLNFVGPALDELQIKRNDVLGLIFLDRLGCGRSWLTMQHIIEVDAFRKRNCLSRDFVIKWVQAVCPSAITEKSTKLRLKKAIDQHRKLVKTKTPVAINALDCFRNSLFFGISQAAISQVQSHSQSPSSAEHMHTSVLKDITNIEEPMHSLSHSQSISSATPEPMHTSIDKDLSNIGEPMYSLSHSQSISSATPEPMHTSIDKDLSNIGEPMYSLSHSQSISSATPEPMHTSIDKDLSNIGEPMYFSTPDPKAPAVRTHRLVYSLQQKKEECEILTDVVNELQHEKRELQAQLEHFKWMEKTANQAFDKLAVLKTEKKSLEAQVKALKKTPMYRRYIKTTAELNNLQQQKARLNLKCADKGKKIIAVQKRASKLKARLHNSKKQIVVLESQVHELKDIVLELTEKCKCLKEGLLSAEEKKDKIKLKDETGKYTAETVRCVIELIGECEAPAKKCGNIIQCVLRNITGLTVSDDVPSVRSALRFVDQGHYLAKYQAAERMMTESWDLHTDGTSRDHRKYLGQQVMTSSGSMSLGFNPVATEDTVTLMDVTFGLLQELTEVYSNETEVDESFNIMLSKMTGLMSDRAAVMKSFHTSFDERRKELLKTNESLQMLHCNAHFLLGLSSAVEKVVKQYATEFDGPIGKDKNPLLAKYSAGEDVASRYVRTACDILGPRGDDKNGCQDQWRAYCNMTNKISYVGSFRSNRFNNLFQSAAALSYHRNDIKNFLGDYMNSPNLKVKSVMEDCQDTTINAILKAIGIMFDKITGPFWNLLLSHCHYLDFYKYVADMYLALKEWSEDPGPALLENTVVFPHNLSLPKRHYLTALYLDLPVESKSVIQKLSVAFTAVIEKQLHDFLPGGVFHNKQDPVLREKMTHCSLTNLLGEACLGDLDYSIFKRRHTTVHHHSTLNMLKRNKTMSVWFANKSIIDQKDHLSKAAKAGPGMRTKNNEKEGLVLAAIKKRLEKKKEERQHKAEAVAERKRQIALKVVDHGGPCTSLESVNNLLASCKSKTAQKAAVTLELQYLKHVIGVKSVRVTGTLDDCVGSLRKQISGSTDATPLPLPIPKTQSQNCLSSSPSSLIDIDSDDDHSEATSEMLEEFTFKTQGENVAVHYDKQFYIGEVLNIKSPVLATIGFLEQCGIKENSFRWPRREDQEDVEAEFVFYHGFSLTQANQLLWSMSHKDYQKLLLLHEKYKLQL